MWHISTEKNSFVWLQRNMIQKVDTETADISRELAVEPPNNFRNIIHSYRQQYDMSTTEL